MPISSSGIVSIMTLDPRKEHKFPSFTSCTVAIVGLGYVGLPLAIEFASRKSCARTGDSLNRSVIGFDIDEKRLNELRNHIDRTNEISTSSLKAASQLTLTNEINTLASADVFIITVPTPIDEAKNPDFTPLISASKTVGAALKSRIERDSATIPLVIYESTVYPGATEEICIPNLEKASGLRFNIDFECGYSPERINPGDKSRQLTSIVKVTSGSTKQSAQWIDSLYGSIIEAGTHLASSLNVAEAAKVIENTQRDLNIALINELSIIFGRLGIDTLDVLEAAGSKWNFLPFRPGLVGGHCIGVDPYYLTHKAEMIGYHPELVLACRRINDRMPEWIAENIIFLMAKNNIAIGGSTALILGLTFKENCPDLRNTKVIDLIKSLNRYSISSIVDDPLASSDEAASCYGISLNTSQLDLICAQIVIVAVAHKEYKSMSVSEWKRVANGKIVIDIKGIVPRELNPFRI